MEFDLREFVASPSWEAVWRCTKDNLFLIAGHYGVEVNKQAKKAALLQEVSAALISGRVLPAVQRAPGQARQSAAESVRLKELDVELQRLSTREREMQLMNELEMRKLEVRMKELELGSIVRPAEFDVAKYIRLVPPFNEDDVDKYFVLFERVATTLKWPRNVWTLLLQCVLVGKAQQVCSLLPPEDSVDFDKVKVAVLRAYELVPEAYRQRFRRLRKQGSQTFVEFVREKEALFDRWCSSSGVTDFNELKQLVLMEDFKNCLPEVVATYLNEHKANDVFKAAVLVEEYTLTHKPVFVDRPFNKPVGGLNCGSFEGGRASLGVSEGERKPASFNRPAFKPDRGGPFVKEGVKCFYCKERGHIVAECPVLGRGNVKPVSLVNSLVKSSDVPVVSAGLADFAPFIMDGWVSLSGGGREVPVKILRDSAASQSFILEGVLPLGQLSALGSDVPVVGFGMEDLGVPLHRVHLRSDLLSGEVTVGVRPAFPVQGVAFLMGNDLAGGKVLVTPGMTPVPVSQSPDELARKFPTVFAACAVTRSRYKKSEEEVDLSDSFLCVNDDLPPSEGDTEAGVSPELKDLTLSREQLGRSQRADVSLSSLFEAAVAAESVDSLSTGFFVKDGVLMRKFTPPEVSPADDWRVSTQVVVPRPYRSEILSLAHETPLSGHLGVRKTYDRILRNFFWPGLKGDVARFCKSCHTCQVAGKPNQVIPPAPLYPIPVMCEPFERVLVDCVGPLPRTKSGNKFLLTVMCASTRFPEVFPLRKITAPVVVRALTKFFSLFGLPKVVQTDQGSNFMSRLFAQVLKQLQIKHLCSSAYHPESQGALERFHQTLKSMLRTYCLEFQKEWDEGVHLQLFAIREVVQESLGFSPAELVFGHAVRGPLKLLREKWLDESTERNLLDYVCDFRTRLRRACEIARGNLESAQAKMKCWFDKNATNRVFRPGDRVLVLLPLPGCSLQARYSGPYLVKEKVGDRDYIVATPDRRCKRRLCHVNMLKLYCEREEMQVPETDRSPESLSGAEAVSPRVSLVTGATGGELSSAETDSSLSVALTEGKLSNSAVLAELPARLSHLTETQRADVVALIGSYSELFNDVPSQTHLVTHDIDVEGSGPIKQHPYRASPEKRARLKKQVSYMLQHGIAEPSCSAWSSPCLLVVKANGDDRFCTDLRKVNSVTKPDCYPLPRMEDCVDRVGGARFVTKLDLLKGYWQVPLTERAKEISAFVTPDDFLQYRVMAFGMRNAPATFQRLMNVTLSGLSCCEAYLDDLVVCSESWAEHVEHLESVFSRLKGAGLTVNLTKCEFAQAKVTYLGKVVGGGQVRPVHAKVESILNFPAPTNRTELRRYLAMVGYYRGFCKNFSSVASPLTDLLSPKVSFTWTEACQTAFQHTKSLLSNAPVLSAPRFDCPFKLAVDASDTGVGGVLLQEGPDGVDHPVSFFSKKLDCHQKWYSTIEKETLALVWALEHFEVYVGSTCWPLTVFTDHNPLVFLSRMRNKNRRLMCWSLRLQAFNIEIKHVRGRDNVLADALSRQ